MLGFCLCFFESYLYGFDLSHNLLYPSHRHSQSSQLNFVWWWSWYWGAVVPSMSLIIFVLLGQLTSLHNIWEILSRFWKYINKSLTSCHSVIHFTDKCSFILAKCIFLYLDICSDLHFRLWISQSSVINKTYCSFSINPIFSLLT